MPAPLAAVSAVAWLEGPSNLKRLSNSSQPVAPAENWSWEVTAESQIYCQVFLQYSCRRLAIPVSGGCDHWKLVGLNFVGVYLIML